jgi:uncharacterized protein YaaW (UPF0174 family)
VDELRAALELATDEELQELTEILFRPKFNPLDYVNTPHPLDVQSQDREAWLAAIDQRFRYLAADGVTVLQRRTDRITYRQVLIQICRYLKLPYQGSISTTDLEAEIFLALMNRAWKQLPVAEQRALTQRVQRSLATSTWGQQLPLALQKDPLNLMLKGGSALAVSAVLKPLLLQHIARQFALHFARYQVAREVLTTGGTLAATQVQHHFTLQVARQGMAGSVARYGATRTVFAFLGSALWAWFLADLGWRAIATNYARVIPTVFALAQIRLTRSEDYCEVV